MKRLSFFLIALFLFRQAFSQSIDEQAADFLRQSDKLYVVITVLVTIFAVLIVFLILQERRISKLEQQLKDKNS